MAVHKGKNYGQAPKGKAFEYSSGKYKDGAFTTLEVDVNAPMVSEAYPAMKLKYTTKTQRSQAQEILGVSGYHPLKKGLFISDKDYVQQYNQEKGNDNTHMLYGFRFLYNPTTISMGYGFADGFDPSLLLSGQDPTNFVTPIEGSTFQFSLIINRIDDMKYLDEHGIKKNHDPYPRPITDVTAKKIRKMGTMYDIEYLLSVISGYKIKTKFRGNTADFGYLGGTPFLMKLNDYMKYSVYCSGITVEHAMFDHRMVPTLTNVSLTLTRYVDNAVTKEKKIPPPAKKTTPKNPQVGVNVVPEFKNGRPTGGYKQIPATIQGVKFGDAGSLTRTYVLPQGSTLYNKLMASANASSTGTVIDPSGSSGATTAVHDAHVTKVIKYLKDMKFEYKAHVKKSTYLPGIVPILTPVIIFAADQNIQIPSWVYSG